MKVRGRIRDKEYDFILDTGASSSIIHPEVAGSDLVVNRDYKLKTATGQIVPVYGTTVIRFQIGNMSFEHEFLVAKISDKCLLGVDFMSDNEIGRAHV